MVKKLGIPEESSKMEPFWCNLHDLFVQNGKGDIPEIKFSTRKGYPKRLLFKLMRDIVSQVANLHNKGIIHGNLKPQNVFIFGGTSLCVKIIPETTEGCETYADDLFAIGCILYFCISGGKYIFCTSCGKLPFADHNILYDSHTSKSILHLFQVDFSPEARHVISQLLDCVPDKRPRAVEVLRHPLFWDAKMRVDFLCDAFCIVDKAVGETKTALFESFAGIHHDALYNKFYAIGESFSDKGFYRKDHDTDSKKCAMDRLKALHESAKRRRLYSGVQCSEYFEKFEKTHRFDAPGLLIEVYKVMSKHAIQIDGIFVNKYLSMETWNSNGNEDEKAEKLLIVNGYMEEEMRKSPEHGQNGIKSEIKLKRDSNKAYDEGQEYETIPAEYNLKDLFVHCKGNMARSEFLDHCGYLVPWLLNLMRDIVSKVAQLHYKGIIHGNLNTNNVLISHGSCHFEETTAGSGNFGCQTYADDIFALGCIMFFCVSGGKYLFCTHCSKYPFGEDDVLHNSNISNNVLYLSGVELDPLAADLISRLLHPSPDKRPRAAQVIDHPLFWDVKKRLEFYSETSSIVEKVAGKTRIALLESLKSVDVEYYWIRRYDTYDSFYKPYTDLDDAYGSVGPFLKEIHYKYKACVSSGVPVDPDKYVEIEEFFKLTSCELSEVYSVMSKHASEIDAKFVAKYCLCWINTDRSYGSLMSVMKNAVILGGGVIVVQLGRRLNMVKFVSPIR